MIRLARATKCQEQSLNRVGQVCFVRRRLKLGPIVRQPLSQAAPLQHGRKALHRRRPTLPRSLHRAISRRSYDQLGALKPVLVPARPRQPLHDLPPPNGRLWLSRPRRNSAPDHGHLMAFLNPTYQTLAHNECWRERARLRWRRSPRAAGAASPFQRPRNLPLPPLSKR